MQRSPIPLPGIHGNQRQFQQLFQNLISNSIKYSKPDTPPFIRIRSKKVTAGDYPEMRISADEDASYHLLEITDNGIGFEKEDAIRIFTMFHRLRGRSDYSGTGIGLSIVRKVVENHEAIFGQKARLVPVQNFHCSCRQNKTCIY
jgi:signal transduction histidine kinase